MADPMVETEGPSLADVWDVAYVAYSYDRFLDQAARQIEPYEGRRFKLESAGEVRCWDPDPDADYPLAWLVGDQPLEITVHGFAADDFAWDEDVGYPIWAVEVHAETVTLEGGRVVQADGLEFEYEAPGIGTAEGFANDDNLVWPVSTSEALRADEDWEQRTVVEDRWLAGDPIILSFGDEA